MIVLVCGIPASGKTSLCEGKEAFHFDKWLKAYYRTDDVEYAGWLFINDSKGLDAYLDAVVNVYEAGDCGELWLDDGVIERKRRKAIVQGLRERGVKEIKCLYLLCDLYVSAARNQAREWEAISRNNFYGSWSSQEYPLESEGFDSIEFKVTV